MEKRLLDWAMELQALAQTGLAYGKDRYDMERFERIREISAEMMNRLTDEPIEKIKALFCNETGYQTPKIDTRAAVVEGNRILLVQELDGLWSLPGGWCDMNKSVGDNTLKELWEEAGVEGEVLRLIALTDYRRHRDTPRPYGICKAFSLCRRLGGEFRSNIETLASGFFAADELPPLALEKTNREEIEMCFAAAKDEHWKVILE